MALRDDILANPDCQTPLNAKDCAEVARIISVGRTKLGETRITERGVRAALSLVDAANFLGLLKSTADATTTPDWLTTTLTGLGVPVDQHPAYFDAFACAHGWLKQEAGIDLGVQRTRDMLDIIKASDATKYGAAVDSLKALAQYQDTVTAQDVADAMFNPDGSSK